MSISLNIAMYVTYITKLIFYVYDCNVLLFF